MPPSLALCLRACPGHAATPAWVPESGEMPTGLPDGATEVSATSGFIAPAC